MTTSYNKFYNVWIKNENTVPATYGNVSLYSQAKVDLNEITTSNLAVNKNNTSYAFDVSGNSFLTGRTDISGNLYVNGVEVNGGGGNTFNDGIIVKQGSASYALDVSGSSIFLGPSTFTSDGNTFNVTSANANPLNYDFSTFPGYTTPVYPNLTILRDRIGNITLGNWTFSLAGLNSQVVWSAGNNGLEYYGNPPPGYSYCIFMRAIARSTSYVQQTMNFTAGKQYVMKWWSYYGWVNIYSGGSRTGLINVTIQNSTDTYTYNDQDTRVAIQWRQHIMRFSVSTTGLSTIRFTATDTIAPSGTPFPFALGGITIREYSSVKLTDSTQSLNSFIAGDFNYQRNLFTQNLYGSGDFGTSSGRGTFYAPSPNINCLCINNNTFNAGTNLNNIAIGKAAYLKANGTQDNINIGSYQNLIGDTNQISHTGQRNIQIGNNQEGSANPGNILIGHYIKSFASSIGHSIAIGNQIGAGGNDNDLLGQGVGSRTVAIGYRCFSGAVDPYNRLRADYCVAVGHQAMQSSADYYNVGVGSFALQNMLGFAGAIPGSATTQHNTAIGYQAGRLRTNFNRCTFIGANTDLSGNIFTDCTALGYNARCGANFATAIGSGVYNETENSVRIGRSSDKVFIDGGLVATNGSSTYALDISGNSFLSGRTDISGNLYVNGVEVTGGGGGGGNTFDDGIIVNQGTATYAVDVSGNLNIKNGVLTIQESTELNSIYNQTEFNNYVYFSYLGQFNEGIEINGGSLTMSGEEGNININDGALIVADSSFNNTISNETEFYNKVYFYDYTPEFHNGISIPFGDISIDGGLIALNSSSTIDVSGNLNINNGGLIVQDSSANNTISNETEFYNKVYFYDYTPEFHNGLSIPSGDILIDGNNIEDLYVDISNNQTIQGEKKFVANRTYFSDTGFITMDSSNNLFITKNSGISQAGENNLIIGTNNASGSSGMTTAATNNTGFGTETLQSLTSGRENQVYGYSSGSNITTGIQNILGGFFSGYYITTGEKNVAWGSNCFDALTTGNNNTAIGNEAGGQAKTSNRCTFLGWNTSQDVSGNTYADSTAVGAGAKITASNQVVLGTADDTTIPKGKLLHNGVYQNYFDNTLLTANTTLNFPCNETYVCYETGTDFTITLPEITSASQLGAKLIFTIVTDNGASINFIRQGTNNKIILKGTTTGYTSAQPVLTGYGSTSAMFVAVRHTTTNTNYVWQQR
jgi:hypothetical protein